ncbi:MAG TPA: hypothetical protein VGR00_06870 [Thermoanaerobaculia bacterium]|nr:hypothetical protein [Thermoanaerobaculia bacterium]
MLRRSVVTTLAALLFLPAVASPEGETRDPQAVAWARKELAASGFDKWEKARYIQFDFSVDFGDRKAGPFTHRWDRYTGRYRVDVPGEKGYTAYFDVNAPKDPAHTVVVKNGARVSGPEVEKVLANAYGRFINDTYWILAPLKVLDPGVNLGDEGESTFDGKKVHVIRLSFGNVGLTPGDVYKHFLDTANGKMLGWEYQLQGTQPPPTRWKWVDVHEYGGLLLSTRKVTEDGAKTIRTDNVTVSSTVDETALTPPKG